MLTGAAVVGAVGLAVGIVGAEVAYVPASPWELLVAFALCLAGTGLTWLGLRRFTSRRDLRLDRYSRFLRWLLGACVVIVCVLVAGGLVYTSVADLIGDTTWAGLISMLPAAGPMAVFSRYHDIGARKSQQEMAEITAELDQEVRDLMKAHEGDRPHDGHDAT